MILFCSEEFSVGEVSSVRWEGVVGVEVIDEVEGNGEEMRFSREKKFEK